MTKKRIIIGMDGTWQRDDQVTPTNVKRILDCIPPEGPDRIQQTIAHFDGVGATGSILERAWNGATGADLPKKIQEAYENITQNYHTGDDVTLLGFSRGSYTARSLNGMIYKCGILDWDKIAFRDKVNPDDPRIREKYISRAYAFYKSDVRPSSPEGKAFRAENSLASRPKIDLACFDTVGSLGIPLRIPVISHLINMRHQFHDTTLNKNTRTASHAIAIDEHRRAFDVTHMVEDKEHNATRLSEEWFVADHAGIGGGCPITQDFADQAALWIIEKLRQKTNLHIEEDWVKDSFSHNSHLSLAPDAFTNKGGFFSKVTLALTGRNLRPIGDYTYVSDGAWDYVDAQPHYNPQNLKTWPEFLRKPQETIAVAI